MGNAPTLQALALYARDHFGEDGADAPDGSPSSLDVIAEGYFNRSSPEAAVDRLADSLTNRMGARGRTIEPARAWAFARLTVSYLGAAYPDARAIRQDERRMLSRLFWGHLVEARFAAGSSGATGSARTEKKEQISAALV
jgi:hypothetical protein